MRSKKNGNRWIYQPICLSAISEWMEKGKSIQLFLQEVSYTKGSRIVNKNHKRKFSCNPTTNILNYSRPEQNTGTSQEYFVQQSFITMKVGGASSCLPYMFKGLRITPQMYDVCEAINILREMETPRTCVTANACLESSSRVWWRSEGQLFRRIYSKCEFRLVF